MLVLLLATSFEHTRTSNGSLWLCEPSPSCRRRLRLLVFECSTLIDDVEECGVKAELEAIFAEVEDELDISRIL